MSNLVEPVRSYSQDTNRKAETSDGVANIFQNL